MILDDTVFLRTVAAESAWYRSYAEHLARHDADVCAGGLGVSVVADDSGAFGVRCGRMTGEVAVNLARDVDRLDPGSAALTTFLDNCVGVAPGPAWVALVPTLALSPLREALKRLGWSHDGGWHQMWGPTAAVERLGDLPAGVAVREATPADADAFAEAYIAGEEIADPETGRLMARAEFGLVDDPAWIVLTATVDGEPAGFGCFHHASAANAGCLSGGWTRPSLQRRGAQSALIGARADLAREFGADLLISQCGLRTASFRNLQRAGMQSAYTIPLWCSPSAD
jgi:GNAT superfamily N-acetyltransferase